MDDLNIVVFILGLLPLAFTVYSTTLTIRAAVEMSKTLKRIFDSHGISYICEIKDIYKHGAFVSGSTYGDASGRYNVGCIARINGREERFKFRSFNKSLKNAKPGDETEVIFLREYLESQDNMRYDTFTKPLKADTFYGCDIKKIKFWLANGGAGAPVCMLHDDYLGMEKHYRNVITMAVAALVTLAVLLLIGAVLLSVTGYMSLSGIFVVAVLSAAISMAVAAFYPFDI